ncbi:MAG: YaiI/YqxD family protein [Desulfocapsaceae bacterium]|nr:YaiI/YqxD family protein [Desulfocapsaceae bacterium]
MKIWVDADACPRVIKEILFKAADRLSLPLYLVANKRIAGPPGSRLIQSVTVPEGPDAADDYIVHHAAAADLVVTADIPLAARIVGKGGVALDPRGELYTADTIGERLSLRDLLTGLRDEGQIQGGPAQFSMADRQRFASSLDRLLTRLLRGESPR